MSNPFFGHQKLRVNGVGVFHPSTDEVRSDGAEGNACWFSATGDVASFFVRQLLFCGETHDGFAQSKKSINALTNNGTKRKAEKNLKIEVKIEVAKEASNRLYGFQSHPIPATPGRKIAVCVISQFGEESMKVLGVG